VIGRGKVSHFIDYLPRDVVVPSNSPVTRRVGRWTGTAGASGFSAQRVLHRTHKIFDVY